MKRQPAAALETARALVLLVGSTWLFRVGGNAAVSAATERAMAVVPSSREALGDSGVDPWLLVRAIRRARAVWPFPVLCLQTAITFQSMLRAHGLDGRVRIGVRRADETGDVEGHAWVEIGGLTLDADRLASGFLPIEQVPSVERAS